MGACHRLANGRVFLGRGRLLLDLLLGVGPLRSRRFRCSLCRLELRLLCLLLLRRRLSSQLPRRHLSLNSVVQEGSWDCIGAQLVASLNLAVLNVGLRNSVANEQRMGCSGTGIKSCKGWICCAELIQRGLSNRVSRKTDDIPPRGLLQRLAGAAPRNDNIVRFLVKCVACLHNTLSKCAHAYCTCTCGHYTCSPQAERGPPPQAWRLRKGA